MPEGEWGSPGGCVDFAELLDGVGNIEGALADFGECFGRGGAVGGGMLVMLKNDVGPVFGASTERKLVNELGDDVGFSGDGVGDEAGQGGGLCFDEGQAQAFEKGGKCECVRGLEKLGNVGAEAGEVNMGKKAEIGHFLEECGPQWTIANQEKTRLGKFLNECVQDIEQEVVVFLAGETADVGENEVFGGIAELLAQALAIGGGFEGGEIESAEQNLKARVLLPVGTEEVAGSFGTGGQSVGCVLQDHAGHQVFVGAAGRVAGLIGAYKHVVAVGDADRNAVVPRNGQCVAAVIADVAVDYVVRPECAESAADALCALDGRVMGACENDACTQVEDFFVVKSRLRKVDEKVHGEFVSIDGAQNVQQPGFDASAAKRSDDVKDAFGAGMACGLVQIRGLAGRNSHGATLS